MPKTWMERFPHPGDPPPQPDESEPLTTERADNWFLARYVWNIYVEKLRKHEMARALDDLAKKDVLTPEQKIARNVAALILDGTLWRAAANLAAL